MVNKDFEEKVKDMSTKELCDTLKELYKVKEEHAVAILEGCKNLRGEKVLDILFGSIKVEDFPYFKETYLKMKQKELDI